MKNSLTRFTVVVVLLAQWISVAALMHFAGSMEKMYREFAYELPTITVATLFATNNLLLVAGAAVTTMILVAAECLLKSERSRFVLQVLDFCLWLAIATVGLIAIFGPFAGLISKLSK